MQGHPQRGPRLQRGRHRGLCVRFHPAWGRFKPYMHPNIGNHEITVGGPAGRPSHGVGYNKYFFEGGVQSFTEVNTQSQSGSVNVGPPLPAGIGRQPQGNPHGIVSSPTYNVQHGTWEKNCGWWYSLTTGPG